MDDPFKRKSFADFQAEAEEFDARRAERELAKQITGLQMQKLQQDMATPDIETLANKSLFDFYQGKPLSPEGKAALQTLAVQKGETVEYKPGPGGYVQAVPKPNPYAQFLGGIEGGQFKPAQTPRSALPPSVFGNDPMTASRSAIAQRQGEVGLNPYQTDDLSVTPLDINGIEEQLGSNSPAMKMSNPKDYNAALGVDPYYSNAPDTQLKAAEEALKLKSKAMETDVNTEAFKTQKNYENEIALANEELKTGKANAKVATILGRMREINNALKQKGAIVSSDAPYSQRVAASAATTELGQGIRKFNDPEAQALAEEYTSLQSILLPYYASAAGLGAKSLDSEGERKSILNSFGNPAGIYDANEQQLNTLSSLFGVGENKTPPVVFDERKRKRLQELRAKRDAGTLK